MRLPRTPDPVLTSLLELEVIEVDIVELEAIELECLASLEVTEDVVLDEDVISSTPFPHLESTPAQSESLIFTLHKLPPSRSK